MPIKAFNDGTARAAIVRLKYYAFVTSTRVTIYLNHFIVYTYLISLLTGNDLFGIFVFESNI